MTWQESLEIVVTQTKVERYRWLCSDQNTNIVQRDGYRGLMVRQANGETMPSSGTTSSASPRQPCCGGDITASIYGADPE